MQITLQQVSKRYNKDWVFKNLSYTFSIGSHYAITGPNGSGKSTLLQVIAASTNHTAGNINYFLNNNTSPTADDIYKHISIAAPYLELIEEMTATEFLNFHAAFKPLTHPIQQILQIIGLQNAANKQMRYYSSGMKQRLKLAQAIFCYTPIVLLDEPCTNLDTQGYALYQQLIQNYCNNKLVIISSNEEQEINFCNNRLNIMDWK